MPKLNINSFEELEALIRDWVNFSREEAGPYDFVGMMALLKACLNNLQKHSVEADFEGLDDFFSVEEIVFL